MSKSSVKIYLTITKIKRKEEEIQTKDERGR